MYDNEKFEQPDTLPTQSDTNRWTSVVYDVQFGQVAIVETEPEQEAAFAMSAWGLSQNLRGLLVDYTDTEIRTAMEWLTIQQNAVVADIFDRMQFSGPLTSPLEHLFISIDADLFLPRGLRMPVTCVTNIVPHSTSIDSLDKFVAILDPGEADAYVAERKGAGIPILGERIH